MAYGGTCIKMCIVSNLVLVSEKTSPWNRSLSIVMLVCRESPSCRHLGGKMNDVNIDDYLLA